MSQDLPITLLKILILIKMKDPHCTHLLDRHDAALKLCGLLAVLD